MSFLNGVSDSLSNDSGYIDALKSGVDNASTREKVITAVVAGAVVGAACTYGVIKIRQARQQHKTEKQLNAVVSSIISAVGNPEGANTNLAGLLKSFTQAAASGAR